MQPELVVGLASAGVAALAIAASTFTNVRSLSVQRENTSATLETQRLLAEAQERALRDRSHGEVLREHRAVLYTEVVHWVYDVLSALDDLDESSPGIPRAAWHIDRSVEDEIDLYASDAIHIHFTSLRALLIGLVEESDFEDWPIVTWEEEDGRVSNVVIEHAPALTTWPERSRRRDDAHASGLDLIARIRGEIQGREHSGFFVTYRLSR